MPKEQRPKIWACGFANDTIERNGEAHINLDISTVKMNKLDALRAHASQTAWMMAETTKRVEEGQPMSESWLNVEKFYIIRHEDEIDEPIERVFL